MKKIIVFALLAFSLASCTINLHTVGNGPTGSTHFKKQTFDEAKHFYAVYGILSLGNPKLNTPKDGNYQYMATTNGIDWLISILSGGLIISRTEKIFINQINN